MLFFHYPSYTTISLKIKFDSYRETWYSINMLKAYKYRLYPNKTQAEMFEKHFGCVRFVYNWGLATKVEAYQTEDKSLSCIDLIKKLPTLKTGNPWLAEINS